MKLDKPLIFFIAVLTFLGLFTFYGIYAILVVKDPIFYRFLFIKFLLGNVLLPFLFFFIFAFLKWSTIRKITLPFFLFSLIFTLLAFLPYFQLPGKESARWFYFKNISFQPTEFLKISTLLLIAFIVPLIKRGRDYLIITIFIIGSICVIIYKQPALSNLLIFLAGIAGGFFGLKFSFRNLLIIALIGILIFIIGLTQEYRVKRILSIFTTEGETAYQLKQARLAISSGGIYGKGFGKSEFKLIGIPLMMTDSIFAIYAEETGFIGSLALILIFILFLVIIFQKARLVKNEEKKFFVYGFGTMLSAQIYVHIIANLIVTTGVPLPFFSYGPSNAISLMIGLGIINSLEYS